MAEDNQAFTLWFEPWRYEREESLTAPLLSELIAAVSSRHGRTENEAVRRAAIKTGKRLLGRLAKATLRTGAHFVAGQIGMNSESLEKLGEEFGRYYDEEMGSFQVSETETQAFRADFDKLVRLAGVADNAAVSARQTRPVCVFIDDLDRCSPNQVVRMLEAVKTLLWADGVVFFMALDQAQILRILANERSDGSGLAGASYYLEKFFLYGIDLDDQAGRHNLEVVPAQRRQFWDDFSDEMERLYGQDLDRRMMEQFREFFKYTPNNLRRIKRALRWAYFEVGRSERTYGIAARFVELVFAECFPEIWLELLAGKPLRVRVGVYKAINDIVEFEIADSFEKSISDETQPSSNLSVVEMLRGAVTDSSKFSVESAKRFVGTDTAEVLAQFLEFENKRETTRLSALTGYLVQAIEKISLKQNELAHQIDPMGEYSS